MGIVSTLFRLDKDEFDIINSKKIRPNVKQHKYLYIDKSWEIITPIITGKIHLKENIISNIVYPENSLLLYQDEFFKDQIFYSSPEIVKKINKTLSKMEIQQFKLRYEDLDLLNLSQALFNMWGDKTNYMNYLVNHFRNIKAFYSSASKSDEYVFTNIS